MSSRSSTGVIVALVVFVVLSVSLLAVSIVLYNGKTAAETKANEAKVELDGFIRPEERSTTQAQALKAGAGAGSVYALLSKQAGDVGEFVAGDRGADLGEMRRALGLGENDTVRDAMRKLAQDRDARAQEASSLKSRSSELGKQIDALNDQLADSEKAREEAIAEITATIASYQQAGEGYRSEFDSARAALDQVRSDMDARHSSEISALQGEIDILRSDKARLDDRVAALQRKVDATSMKAGNPATFVDASVLDFDPRSNTLFIDIGADKRVVPGMTFELFDDAPAIVAAAGSGSRGKASVQVVKVGDTTSTCRVLRSSGASPIVKGDVAANAVFNPNHSYKFLVHGNFDVNGDGRATASEAEFVRSRIAEWGGEVVEGDSVSGDLDFVVMGSQPPYPPALASDATEAQIFAYTEARAARELYESIFQTASDAEIPVLNFTRFQSLTGSVNR